MDEGFLLTQLEASRSAACEVCPGIEVNYDPEIVRTDAGYVRESLSAVRLCGFDRAVLCWNVLRTPRAHLDAAAEAAVP